MYTLAYLVCIVYGKTGSGLDEKHSQRAQRDPWDFHHRLLKAAQDRYFKKRVKNVEMAGLRANSGALTLKKVEFPYSPTWWSL